MARKVPARLAEKLTQIRIELGYSQRGLIKAMQLEGELAQAEISMFEAGKRVPNLLVLRCYGKIAGICTDFLIEDNWNLPKLPAENKIKNC